MNNMENAVVIGYGTIGKATAKMFGIKKYISRSKSNITYEDAKKSCKFIFICLPTNVDSEGRYQTDDLEEIIQKIGTDENIIILRSTLAPGSTTLLSLRYGLNIVYNPEFLSEKTATKDALNPDLIVLGSRNKKALRAVKKLYKKRFPHIDPIITDPQTAEFIKIGLNAFFTTKVVFANEMFDYADYVKADYKVFKRVIEGHKWGSKNHFSIFHKGGRGAGGKCLKKDIEAINYYSGRTLFSIIKNINNLLLDVSGKK